MMYIFYMSFLIRLYKKRYNFRKNFIISNREKYRAYSKNKKTFYTQYLKFNKIDLNKRLIVVDSATMRFSAQELLSSIIGNDVFGIYFYVRNKTHKNFNYQSVYDYK